METNTFATTVYAQTPAPRAFAHLRRLQNLDEWTLGSRMLTRIDDDTFMGTASGYQAALCYHVRTLERMGLVELVRETRVRGAVEHHYRSCGRPTVTDEAWAAAPAIAKQAAVSASLQTIDAYARAASAAGGFDHGNSHLTRTQLTLDARGWSDLSRACLRLLDQVDRIGQAAKERVERNHRPRYPHRGFIGDEDSRATKTPFTTSAQSQSSGAGFTSRYIFPMYSPTTPGGNNCNPPVDANGAIMEALPGIARVKNSAMPIAQIPHEEGHN
jgi:hypothetical protein